MSPWNGRSRPVPRRHRRDADLRRSHVLHGRIPALDRLDISASQMGDASTMIILASLEAVAPVIIVFLMLKHQTVQDQAWTAERRELLERIQSPDRIPSTPADPFVFYTATEPAHIPLG